MNTDPPVPQIGAYTDKNTKTHIPQSTTSITEPRKKHQTLNTNARETALRIPNILANIIELVTDKRHCIRVNKQWNQVTARIEYPRHLARLIAFEHICIEQRLETFIRALQNNRFESGLATILRDPETVIRLPVLTKKATYSSNLALFIDLVGTKDECTTEATRNVIGKQFVSSITLHGGYLKTVELNHMSLQNASDDELFDELADFENCLADLPKVGITFNRMAPIYIGAHLKFYEVLCASEDLGSRIAESLDVFPLESETWNRHTLRLLEVLQPECLYITLTDSGHPLDKLSVRHVRNTAVELFVDYCNAVLEAQNAFANLMRTFGVGEQLKSFTLRLQYHAFSEGLHDNSFRAWLELLRRYHDALGTKIILNVPLDHIDEVEDEDGFVPNRDKRLLVIEATLNRYCVRHILDKDESCSYKAVFTLFMKGEE